MAMLYIQKIMKEVFVVMMYRWGEIKNHNYLLGVFENVEHAVNTGMEEKLSRGNKYEPYVMKSCLNGFKGSNINYVNTNIVEKEFRGIKFYIKKFNKEG